MTLLTDWGRKDPWRARAVAEEGLDLEPLADPRAEPGYDLNHKEWIIKFKHLISKRASTEEGKRRWAWRKRRGT